MKKEDIAPPEALDKIREKYKMKYATAAMMKNMHFMTTTGDEYEGQGRESPFNAVRDDYSKQIGPYTV